MGSLGKIKGEPPGICQQQSPLIQVHEDPFKAGYSLHHGGGGVGVGGTVETPVCGMVCRQQEEKGTCICSDV